jgi:hypothetical protein
VSSSQASHDGRIDTRTVDGRVVIAVHGAELFDVVDDYLTAVVDAEILYRLPGDKTTPKLAIHELILPEAVGLETILNLLKALPSEEARAARVADDAT